MISEISLAMVNGLTAIAKCHSSYPTQAKAIKQVADIYNRTSLTPFAKKVFSFWPGLRRLELPAKHQYRMVLFMIFGLDCQAQNSAQKENKGKQLTT